MALHLTPSIIDLLIVLLVPVLALAIPLLGVAFSRLLVWLNRSPKTDPLAHPALGADSPRHDSHPMTVSLPKGTMVMIFVPFDSSQQRFDGRLRETLAALETPEAREQPVPSDLKRSDDETLPLWTWFLPNPCPNREGR